MSGTRRRFTLQTGISNARRATESVVRPLTSSVLAIAGFRRVAPSKRARSFGGILTPPTSSSRHSGAPRKRPPGVVVERGVQRRRLEPTVMGLTPGFRRRLPDGPSRRRSLLEVRLGFVSGLVPDCSVRRAVRHRIVPHAIAAPLVPQSESHDSTPPASKGSDSRRRRAPFEEADPGVR